MFARREVFSQINLSPLWSAGDVRALSAIAVMRPWFSASATEITGRDSIPLPLVARSPLFHLRPEPSVRFNSTGARARLLQRAKETRQRALEDSARRAAAARRAPPAGDAQPAGTAVAPYQVAPDPSTVPSSSLAQVCQ